MAERGWSRGGAGRGERISFSCLCLAVTVKSMSALHSGKIAPMWVTSSHTFVPKTERWEKQIPLGNGVSVPPPLLQAIISTVEYKDQMGILAHQAMSLNSQGWKANGSLFVGRISRAQWNKNGQLLSLPFNQSCALCRKPHATSSGPAHLKKHERDFEPTGPWHLNSSPFISSPGTWQTTCTAFAH